MTVLDVSTVWHFSIIEHNAFFSILNIANQFRLHE